MSAYFGTTQDDLINTIFVTGGVTGPMDPATGKIIPPGDANDSIITFDGDDIVQTGGGNDQVDLGNGDDTFVLNVGDDDDFIHAGFDFDTLIFRASSADESIEIVRDEFLKAHLTSDDAGVDAETNLLERMEIAALGGADQIAVRNLTGTEVLEIAIDLDGQDGLGLGDGAKDSILVDGRNDAADSITVSRAGGIVKIAGLTAEVAIDDAEESDTLTIKGFGGDDTLDASGLPSTTMQLTLDGGDGNDTVIGGAADDFLAGDGGNDTVTGGEGDDVASLGTGDDVFVWNTGDGDDQVNGESGFDVWHRLRDR